VVGQEVVVMGKSGGSAIATADIARWQGVGVHDVLMALSERLPQHFS
jgi:hypothetical protein